MKKILVAAGIIFLSQSATQAQIDIQNPLGSSSPLELDGKRGFLRASGAAGASILVAMLFKTGFEAEHFVDYQGGIYPSYTHSGNVVVSNNIGLYRRFTPWFALSIRLNMHNSIGQDQTNIGGGMKAAYRWYLFGKKKIRPFFEYGAGFMAHVLPFPTTGSNFVFTPSYHAGLEIQFQKYTFLRFAMGHMNTTNFRVSEQENGWHGNGFSLAFAYRL